MEIKEAIRRIDNHKHIHFADEYPRAIKITEALEMAMNALEKQIAKKPVYGDYDEDDDGENVIPCSAVCPVCSHEFEFGYWNDEDNHHCVCGQAIDWS